MVYFIGSILRSFYYKSTFELNNLLSTCFTFICNVFFCTSTLEFDYFSFTFCTFSLTPLKKKKKNFKLDLSSSTCSTFISRFELWLTLVFLSISIVRCKNLKQSWSYSPIIANKEDIFEKDDSQS